MQRVHGESIRMSMAAAPVCENPMGDRVSEYGEVSEYVQCVHGESIRMSVAAGPVCEVLWGSE